MDFLLKSEVQMSVVVESFDIFSFRIVMISCNSSTTSVIVFPDGISLP